MKGYLTNCILQFFILQFFILQFFQCLKLKKMRYTPCPVRMVLVSFYLALELALESLTSIPLDTPALVCLLAQDIGDTSQGHRTVGRGPEIGTGGPMAVPTRPCQESIGPRLLGARSCANNQTSIALYLGEFGHTTADG
jgi:hypothetical protein